jgi:hypothetical protein
VRHQQKLADGLRRRWVRQPQWLAAFFPTRLRFEDYIYRLWVMQPQVAAAHVDAAQTRTKNTYMRDPAAAEVFNEAMCNLLKRKIHASLKRSDEFTIAFDYDGAVSLQDSEEILASARALHAKILSKQTRGAGPARREALALFAAALSRAFYDFEPDFFQQNVARIVDDEIALIRSTLEIWPTLLEIVFFEKHRNGLPMRRVANKERTNGRVLTATASRSA